MNPSDNNYATFDVQLTFKGKKSLLPDVTANTTMKEFNDMVRSAFDLEDATAIKLIHKGKVLKESPSTDDPSSSAVLTHLSINTTGSKITPKVIVMATTQQSRSEISQRKSDPTIRGFDQEKDRDQKSQLHYPWGPSYKSQDKNYKFCKFQACTWQSFGHRASSSQKTPHAFEAMKLLEKLATDPGVVAIMVERELVVGTLAEMDPIDDRLAQKKKAQNPHSCLLGYNTNFGSRIDIKLRPDDLNGFLPYNSIVSTLVHELSHNWVGDHNALFWSNYGQMRVEYLYSHARLYSTGYVIEGRTSAAVADVEVYCRDGNKRFSMRSIYEKVIEDVRKECVSHGVPIEMIAPAVWDRCREIEEKEARDGEDGRQSVGGRVSQVGTRNPGIGLTPRDLAHAAAERRARDRSQKKNDEK